MFEKIGKIFSAVVAVLAAVLGVFFAVKSKKQNDLDRSFDKARKEFLEKNEVIVDDHDTAVRKIEKEYEEAVKELTDNEQKDLEEVREKYDSEVADIYERNRNNPEALVEELSKKYGLKNVK